MVPSPIPVLSIWLELVFILKVVPCRKRKAEVAICVMYLAKNKTNYNILYTIQYFIPFSPEIRKIED